MKSAVWTILAILASVVVIWEALKDNDDDKF
jgi:hypothetical protein